ncbi:MAG: biopolymer transporter ExbD [Candidatus Endonucleobacter sp. (ex Gigantidas childressi)]|nr:biopolymer transporter ExbD [Candidatus Endonucleobacter sp. (ex Gigantidas childressi)]
MRRERFDKMNIVPFIDIVLVLLVIVLATSSFVQNKAININLPSATTKKQEDSKNLIIYIDKNGKYVHENKILPLKEIQNEIEKLNPKKDKISLHTDKNTDFHYFVDIVDFIQQKGFKNISIVTS